VGLNCEDANGVTWSLGAAGVVAPVLETAPVGQSVAKVPGPQQDGGPVAATFTLAYSNNNGRRVRSSSSGGDEGEGEGEQIPFAIDKVSGQIVVAGPLDYETAAWYNMTVIISAFMFYKETGIDVPIAAVACGASGWSVTGTHPCAPHSVCIAPAVQKAAATATADVVCYEPADDVSEGSTKEESEDDTAAGSGSASVLAALLVAGMAAMAVVVAVVLKRQRQTFERESAEEAAAAEHRGGFTTIIPNPECSDYSDVGSGGLGEDPEYGEVSGASNNNAEPDYEEMKALMAASAVAQTSDHSIYEMAAGVATQQQPEEEATYAMATQHQPPQSCEATYDVAANLPIKANSRNSRKTGENPESIYEFANSNEAVYDLSTLANLVQDEEDIYTIASSTDTGTNLNSNSNSNGDEEDMYAMATAVGAGAWARHGHVAGDCSDDEEMYAIATAVGAGMGNNTIAEDDEAMYAIADAFGAGSNGGRSGTLDLDQAIDKMGTMDGVAMDAIYAMGNNEADEEPIYAMGNDDDINKMGTMDGVAMDAIYAMGNELTTEGPTSQRVVSSSLLSPMSMADGAEANPLFMFGDEPDVGELTQLPTLASTSSTDGDSDGDGDDFYSLTASASADSTSSGGSMPEELRGSWALPSFTNVRRSESLRGKRASTSTSTSTRTPPLSAHSSIIEEDELVEGVASLDYLGLGSEAGGSTMGSSHNSRSARSAHKSSLFEDNAFVHDTSSNSIRLKSVRRSNPLFRTSLFRNQVVETTDDTYTATAESV